MKTKHLKPLLVVFVVAVSLLGGSSVCPPAEANDKPIKLTYAFFAPAGTFPGKQMAHWAEEIEKRTEGLVKVQTFPGGTLLGARDMYDGVSSGVADIGLGSPSYDPGRFPLTSGVALPVKFPNATVASLTLLDLMMEFKPAEYEPFKIITMFTTEPGHIQSRDPVASLEDLKGMKLRAAGTGVPVLKALGAAPVGMPMPQVPESVQTGVIDGTMTSREVLKDFKLAEMLHHVLEYPTVVVTFAAVMDKKKWDALPDKVKKVIDELAREMAIWTGQYHDKQNVGEALAWAKKEHDLQIHTLSEEETAKWDALLAPMVQTWTEEMEAKGLPAAKFLERLRQLRDQYAQEYQ
ncbi:MAG: TRAP transporter substrate-binding protein [Desulfobacterales bacterium]|nr:MAG: TRAP transporter substrate-binding protein [Desulfobacterales bacterium]